MKGAIAAGHPLTAETGAAVLESGGNAVDACIAAAFAAAVAEGPLTGPAGGGFLLVHSAKGETTLLDCFFAVPARRTEEMEEVVIDFDDAGTQTFHVGEASVAVPGLLAAYRVLECTPLRARVLEHELLTTPTPSKGGSIVLDVLAALAALQQWTLDGEASAVGSAYGRSAAGTLTGTTHISVVDGAGTAASLSSTLGSGSGVFRGGTQ